MMTPTEILREEHRVILAALDTLEMAADRLAAGRPAPEPWWEDMLAWLGAFVERTHHAREEQSLFSVMAKAGAPTSGGPIAVMLEEHAEGRGYVQALAREGGAARVAAARNYARLLRAHIDKENEVVYPLAEAVLDRPAMEEVARGFERVDSAQGVRASIPNAEADLARLTMALA
jgi:hemerythrin-like domain-containing protein